VLVPPKAEPCDIQTWPFQAAKKEDVPSAELGRYKFPGYYDTIDTHLPAAKILLQLPLLTVMAVTGPGRLELSPKGLQLSLLNVYCKTLSEDDPDSVIEPPATSTF
jgi:hypothetical protein